MGLSALFRVRVLEKVRGNSPSRPWYNPEDYTSVILPHPTSVYVVPNSLVVENHPSYSMIDLFILLPYCCLNLLTS